MKAVVALLVLLMSVSVIAIAGGAVEFDPLSGIPLQDEFTERFLPASSMGDVPTLKTILEEKKKTLAEEGEMAMLLYQLGLAHFMLGERYFTLELVYFITLMKQ